MITAEQARKISEKAKKAITDVNPLSDEDIKSIESAIVFAAERNQTGVEVRIEARKVPSAKDLLIKLGYKVSVIEIETVGTMLQISW